jgi:hypothetical protein
MNNDTARANPCEPRRLQLSRILLQIYEEACGRSVDCAGGAAATAANAAPTPASPAAAPDSEPGSRRERPRKRKERQLSNISIGEIVDRAEHAGFGFVLAFLALVSIPFVGLSTPFGLAIAFGAMQMIIGLHRPWMPKIVRRRRISVETIDWLGQKLVKWTSWMERLIRPRFIFLTQGPFWTLCGFGILLQGLALALPLPIPGSNWIFIFPVILYAIGLLENDGLLILTCHLLTLVQGVLAVLFWEVLERGLHRLWGWFAMLM